MQYFNKWELDESNILLNPFWHSQWISPRNFSFYHNTEPCFEFPEWRCRSKTPLWKILGGERKLKIISRSDSSFPSQPFHITKYWITVLLTLPELYSLTTGKKNLQTPLRRKMQMLARNIYTKMQLVIHSKIYASIPLYFPFSILCLNTACFPCLDHPHTHTHTYIPTLSFQATDKQSVFAAHILMLVMHIYH